MQYLDGRQVWRVCNMIRWFFWSCWCLCCVLGAGADEVQFLEKGKVRYQRDGIPQKGLQVASPAEDWIPAWRGEAMVPVELGARIVMQAADAVLLEELLEESGLPVVARLRENLAVVEAPSAEAAWVLCAQWSRDDRWQRVYPVARFPVTRHAPYSAPSRDPMYFNLWHLEARNADGSSAGTDVNVRSAWPVTLAEGVTVAVADDGFQTTHPELSAPAAGQPHYDFTTGAAFSVPPVNGTHGTSVAGLVGARGNNQIGMTGVAASASMASWVIFRTDGKSLDDFGFMQMFQYESNRVDVQNHSWSYAVLTQTDLRDLEDIGIERAVQSGREGKGVVLVRAAGNIRQQGRDANDDGYLKDPRSMTVGAVGLDGQVTSYSTPGACLWVSAPSGDSSRGLPLLVTTDLVGSAGVNTIAFGGDQADYRFGSLGFSGTSGSCPIIAGVAALVLGANPSLSYRDVQQILALSAKQTDPDDPDLQGNGAGLNFSHNTGFGVPDAGVAVRLAGSWISRPPMVRASVVRQVQAVVPEEAGRLGVVSSGWPGPQEFVVRPAVLGPRIDDRSGHFPVTDVGLANGPIAEDLTGRIALIQRGGNTFQDKVERVAAAGAVLAVIYNNVDGSNLVTMQTDAFLPIPAVFLSQNDGESLRDWLVTHSDTQLETRLAALEVSLLGPLPMICEHVGVRVRYSHPSRGDMRITLHSPQGTKSILQPRGPDVTSGAGDWTYYSSAHFLEASTGFWKLRFSDEVPGDVGTITEVTLFLEGVSITDSDGDGLDDSWENGSFGNLAALPSEDPDGDGYSNALEQLLGRHPLQVEERLKMDLSVWNESRDRLSWPSVQGKSYRLERAAQGSGPYLLEQTIPGQFPETEAFPSRSHTGASFFRVIQEP